MYLITVRFSTPRDSPFPSHTFDSPAAPERVRELFCNVSEPADRVEHVYAEARPDAMDLALFLLHPTPATALAAAVRLCRRCLRDQPLLSGWRLAECDIACPDPNDPAFDGPMSTTAFPDRPAP